MTRVAAALLLLVAAGAEAQSPREEAKRHRELGKARFNEGRFAEALDEFQKSNQLAANPDLLWNIGRCQESLHDNAGAIESYQRFLAARPGAKDRGDVEVRIAALKMTMPKQAAPPPKKVDLSAPPSAAPAPAAAPAPVSSPSEAPTPIYRRWWLWAAVAAVVVIGAGIAIGVAASSSARTYTFDGVMAR